MTKTILDVLRYHHLPFYADLTRDGVIQTEPVDLMTARAVCRDLASYDVPACFLVHATSRRNHPATYRVFV